MVSQVFEDFLESYFWSRYLPVAGRYGGFQSGTDLTARDIRRDKLLVGWVKSQVQALPALVDPDHQHVVEMMAAPTRRQHHFLSYPDLDLSRKKPVKVLTYLS